MVIRKRLLCKNPVMLWTKKAASKYCQRELYPKGGTYPTWGLQCQMALMKDGVWGIVNGTETRPRPTEADSVAKFITKWDKKLVILVLSIDPPLLYLIGEPTNPIDVWQKLADQFQRRLGPTSCT